MTATPVFIIVNPTSLSDRMDAQYLHPERLNMLNELKEFEKNKIIDLKKGSDLFVISKNKTTATPDQTLHCIEMKDIDVDYGLINLRKSKVADAGTSLVECKGGQILFSRIRPYLNKITLLPNSVNKAICSQEFYVLSPKYEKTPMGYFWLVLRSQFVLNQIKHLAGGSLRPRINDEDIADLEIPVLKDSTIVSEIDSSTNNALEKFYSYQPQLKTAESNFLTGIDLPSPPKLPNFFFAFAEQQTDSPRQFYRMDPLFFHPSYYKELKMLLEEWAKSHNGSITNLGSLCIKDGIKRRKARLTNWNGSTPRLGVENVLETGILWDCKHVTVAPRQNKAFLGKNDILITSTGIGSTGKTAIYTEKESAITDGHITIVRLKPETGPYYILSYLRCEYARRQMSRMERGTSGQIELYAEDLKNLLIPIPNSEDKDRIEKAQNPLKESWEGMESARILLHKTRDKLNCSITNSTMSESEDCEDTAIPKPEWRIIRP